MAFKFSQDWVCDFSFMASIELRVALPSVVWDEYTAWSESALKGMWFLPGNVKEVSEMTISLIMDQLFGNSL